MSPIAFWLDHLGRHLNPSPKTGEDPVDAALSRTYRHADKESGLRLGSGKAASLIRPGHAVLMADIRLDGAVPDGLEIKPGTWRTVPNWMAEIITDPPPPPFMFVVYGKNPYIKDALRLNLSASVVDICGAESLRCRPATVRAALDAIGDIPATIWRKAASLAAERLSNPASATRIDSELSRIEAKHPTIHDLLDALPPFGTEEYEAVTLVHAVRSKSNAA